MKQKRQLPNYQELNAMRQQLQCQLARSLKSDHENWWIKVAKELEVATASVLTHCSTIYATPVSGKFRLVKSCAIEMESTFMADRRGSAVGLSTSRISIVGLALM